MLTASEKRWLETRTLENFSYCFEWCKLYRTVDCKVKRSLFLCPTQCSPNAIEDALDFSERVAVKLAEAYGTMMDHNEKHSLCQTCRFEVVKTLGCMSTCAETVLRWAQLEIEEEMDANRI